MEHGVVLESVWVAVGFVVFVALVWRKAGAALGGMLDERSAKIRADLDEANVHVCPETGSHRVLHSTGQLR